MGERLQFTREGGRCQPPPRTPSSENPPLSRSRRHRTLSSGIAKKKERDAILALLLARGEWVPLAAISACAHFWGPRIHELRQLGFRIQSKGLGKPDTWFRLEPGAKPNADLNSSVTATPGFPEFGRLSPERYGD